MNTTLPLSLTVQSLATAMLAKPGLRSQFHLMIGIAMGMFETPLKTPTDYVYLYDRSGSTGDIVPGGESTILDTTKEAGQMTLEKVGDQDRVAIVSFDTHPRTELGLTFCDNAGKARITNAIWSISVGSTTEYAPALEMAISLFSNSEGRKKVIVFFTDGANSGNSGDPVPIAQGLGNQGITLYIGGLGVNNKGEKLLLAMDPNFKALTSASEVTKFFADAQAQAASAVVTNAQLRITPVTFATVNNFERVTRGGAPDYNPADANGKLVSIGDISVGDNHQAYLGMQVVLPENIVAGRRAFGKIELIGDVPSDGRKGEVIASTPIAVQFSDTPVPGMNGEVKDMINIAATSREVYQFAQTGNAAHLANARKTVAFSASAVAAALSAQINDITAKVGADPEAAAKQARRATKGFSAADAAAALANMNG